MKRRPHAARLPLLISLLTLATLAVAQAQLPNRAYLPLLQNGRPTPGPSASPGTPTRTATATARTATSTATRTAGPATPSATTTATVTTTPTNIGAPGGVDVSGRVRLRPEAAVYTESVRPQRYVLVFDVSGSQNMTFDGVGSDPTTGEDRQCANGPPGSAPALNCATPAYAYKDETKRRIYVQKQAARKFIELLNMPGNPGYNPERPQDRLAIVWYNHEARAEWVVNFSSNEATLLNAVMQAGSYNNDPYKTASGGTNWAAGLYRAAQLIQSAPTVTYELGRNFDYDDRVILLTDGVSNSFLDPTVATLSAGESGPGTFASGSRCAGLGPAVLEDAFCQTTEGGGTYRGRDRPITQAVNVARQQIQAYPSQLVDVYVVAISNIPAVGLEDGVATNPSRFFAATRLTSGNDGTNIDQIFRLIATRSTQVSCQPLSGDWAEVMGEANVPIVDLVTPPEVGKVILNSASTNKQYSAAILRDAATGRLSFQIADVPAGTYELHAYTFYRGSDGTSRMYALIYQNEQSAQSIVVSLSGNAQNLGMISLLLIGNVCAG